MIFPFVSYSYINNKCTKILNVIDNMKEEDKEKRISILFDALCK